MSRTVTKNVKRRTIITGETTNHNNPGKCLLSHGPFHFAFTSSPDILLSGRRTAWINPLNFLRKIASITLCIMHFPLKVLADHESKWVRITFHRTPVPYKLHSGTGTSPYQLFSSFSHVLCVAAKEQKDNLCWWQSKTHIFRISGGSDQTLNGWRNLSSKKKKNFLIQNNLYYLKFKIVFISIYCSFIISHP